MEPGLLVAVAAAIILFGAVSQRAERSIVTPPIWFVCVGFAICGHGLGWVDLSAGSTVIHGLAELTLVIVLFTDASRIHLSCLRREGSLPARMLGIGLPLTIAAGTLAALLVFPSFGIWQAMLLAAILAPTDAALGQAVVSSPLVPVRIRQALNVESGLNDGIALPVVLVVATLAGAFAGGSSLFYRIHFAALQLVLGPLVGGAVGFAGARLLESGRASSWINEPFAKLVALGSRQSLSALPSWWGGSTSREFEKRRRWSTLRWSRCRSACAMFAATPMSDAGPNALQEGGEPCP